MDVNVNERKVHKVHIQDKKVEEQRADRCSLQSLENDVFSVHLIIHCPGKYNKKYFSECNLRSYCI
jgi:hypothetical protein